MAAVLQRPGSAADPEADPFGYGLPGAPADARHGAIPSGWLSAGISSKLPVRDPRTPLGRAADADRGADGPEARGIAVAAVMPAFHQAGVASGCGRRRRPGARHRAALQAGGRASPG